MEGALETSNDNQNSDPLLADIEKFLYESENMSAPLVVNKGKLYDTQNLLNILEENNNRKKSSEKQRARSVALLNKPKKRKEAVVLPYKKVESDGPPRKRTRSDDNQLPKKILSNNKNAKVVNEKVKPVVPNKRGRPKSKPVQPLQLSKIRTVKEPKWEKAKIMRIPSCRKATVHYLHYHRNQSYKEGFVEVCEKTITMKNIIIKQEVIDLTSEDICINLMVKYPRKLGVCGIIYETCDPLAMPRRERIRPFLDLHTATVSIKPDVRVHLTQAVIDLTVDTNENASLASEKECALKILLTVFKFHQAFQTNRIVVGTLDELNGLESQRENRVSSYMSKQAETMGVNLVEILSGLYVKNFKIETFLEFLVYKLKQKHNVSVNNRVAAQYLQLMLDRNQKGCRNQFLKNFVREIDKMCVKEENEENIVCDANLFEDKVFTEKQLEQLLCQIQQYNEIVRYNQYVASHNGWGTFHPELEITETLDFEINTEQKPICLPRQIPTEQETANNLDQKPIIVGSISEAEKRFKNEILELIPSARSVLEMN